MGDHFASLVPEGPSHFTQAIREDFARIGGRALRFTRAKGYSLCPYQGALQLVRSYWRALRNARSQRRQGTHIPREKRGNFVSLVQRVAITWT